jgi:hypothetical protein
MITHVIQWREGGELLNKTIGAETLEEAKQQLIKQEGIKPSQILKEGAWK